MAANGWASPSGSQDDAYWRRPDPPEGESVSPSSEPAAAYQRPPAMRMPSAQVGWGPLITPGPVPRALPPQDHAALDDEEAQARAVTFGVGVFALVVLFVLLLLVVIHAGTNL